MPLNPPGFSQPERCTRLHPTKAKARDFIRYINADPRICMYMYVYALNFISLSECLISVVGYIDSVNLNISQIPVFEKNFCETSKAL